MGNFSIAQKTDSILNTTFIRSVVVDVDKFIGVDEFDNLYYLKNSTFYKKNDKETLSYTNTQLGNISSVDIKNPLKILLFYSDFNTVIMLDNKLNELSNKVEFNEEVFSKNISLVSGASNNNLWLYSLDDNTLQIYDYQSKTIAISSRPLSFYYKDFKATTLLGTYKYCWVVGENSMIEFNEYGTLLGQMYLPDIDEIINYKDNFIFLKDNALYLIKEDVVKTIDLKQEISIESFYVNNNEIYIFDGTSIFVYGFLKI